MDIGRKIYFDKLGNIILMTCERTGLEGIIRETTIEEDFPEGVPADIDFIQLQYNERAEEFRNIGSIKVDIETRQLIIYPRLQITADKQQILSDGTDTATITVIVADNTYSDTIEFTVDDNTFYPINCLQGTAIFQFSALIDGKYTITAKNAIYGTNSIIVEVING